MKFLDFEERRKLAEDTEKVNDVYQKGMEIATKVLDSIQQVSLINENPSSFEGTALSMF